MLLKFRVRITEVDGRQNRAARELEMSEPRLSRIINEFDTPTPEERKRIIARYGAVALKRHQPKTHAVAQISRPNNS